MRRRAALLAGMLVSAALLAGCSSDTGAAAPKPPAERLASARAALDRAGSVALDLTSRDVPLRENGVTAAKGSGVVSATEPKFAGTITGSIKGVAGTVEVVAIGDTTWMKFFTPDFEKADLSALGAPNPATFFDPAGGISSLLAATQKPVAGEDVRQGSEVLHTIRGTLPGKPVTDLLGLGDGTGSYDVTYGLTDADQLRTATLTGPFFPGRSATYSLVLTKYGAPVEIARP
jgi:lipoprotein LprG